MKIRIYYEDTDCGGVVYYANYLRYLERARTEYFRARSVNIEGLAQKGFLFMVSRVDISYLRPARYNDVLTVHTDVEQVKPASFSLSHQIQFAGSQQTVVRATVDMVCIGRNGKPARLPLEMAKVLDKISLT